MKKNLIISHIADMDGLGGVILTKLVFSNVEVILTEPDDLEGHIEELLKDNKYQQYERIFVTDLGMRGNTGYIINNSPLKDILLHFDHHETNNEVNIYPWSTVISKIGDFRPCGTSIFYNYLHSIYPENDILNYNSLKELVEGIRSYDTYQFKETGDMLGYNLTNVLIAVGRDAIMESIIDRILYDNHDHFNLTEKEIEIYKKADQELESYLLWCDNNLIRMKFLEYNIGLSISTKFRSSVGNLLSEKYKDELDFILIADYDRESFSIRTVNDINVGELCKILGGGGHDKAGGFAMSDENLALTSPYFDKIKLEMLKKGLF